MTRCLFPTARYWLACALAAVGQLSAADQTRNDAGPVVEMPPFVITETRTSGPDWRYAAAEGFEIISQAGEQATQEVFAALWRGPRLTLGKEFWPQTSTPTAVIIFNQPSDRALDSLGSIRSDHEQGSHWTNVIKRTLPDREVFCVNLYGRYFDYSSTFRFDLRTLLALHTPPAPPWLVEALFGTYGLYREGIEYPDRGKATELVSALWCSETELLRADSLVGMANDHFLTAPEKRRGKLAGAAPLRASVTPLAELWNGGLPGDPRPAAESARWAATAAVFVRWAMYAEEGRRHDAFWRFAAAACGKPVDEAMFRESFGFGFEEATNEVAWYLPIAIEERARRSITPLVVPRLSIRPATTAEVARVRGDWERGEAAMLAARFPEIANRYSSKAARTLRTAYTTNPNDLPLAQVLGLYEFESGNNARALELLTTGTATGDARPRAWYTLAHLRFIDAAGKAGGPRNPLPKDEATEILRPLQKAWEQKPAMAVTYELLAELWRRCPELDAQEVIPRLQEGVALFPRQPRLALAAVRACGERGQRAAALGIIDHVLPFTTEPSLRAGLERARGALAQQK